MHVVHSLSHELCDISIFGGASRRYRGKQPGFQRQGRERRRRERRREQEEEVDRPKVSSKEKTLLLLAGKVLRMSPKPHSGLFPKQKAMTPGVKVRGGGKGLLERRFLFLNLQGHLSMTGDICGCTTMVIRKVVVLVSETRDNPKHFTTDSPRSPPPRKPKATKGSTGQPEKPCPPEDVSVAVSSVNDSLSVPLALRSWVSSHTPKT
jgi:hypothetical protein